MLHQDVCFEAIPRLMAGGHHLGIEPRTLLVIHVMVIGLAFYRLFPEVVVIIAGTATTQGFVEGCAAHADQSETDHG